MKAYILILNFLLVSFSISAQTPYVLWHFETNDQSFGQTAMADLTNDGQLNLVFGCYRNDSMIYALNALDGSLLWKYNASGWGEGCNDVAPLITDINNDGLQEVIVPSSCNPKTFCFEGNSGNILWEANTKGSDSPPTLGDIDGDGNLEILHGEFLGYVICLDALSGTLKWEILVDPDSWIQTAPSLYDLNGDGLLDFVVASWNFNGNSKVFAYRGDNQALLWSFNLADVAYHGTAIADLDNDGLPELVIGDYSGKLYCLNGEDGSQSWSYDAGYYVGSPALIADIDGNGECEIIFTAGFKVIALQSNGTFLWDYMIPSYKQAFRGVALADVDNDSLPDVIFGDSGGVLRVLKGDDGMEMMSIDLAAHYGDTFEISTAPVIADFNKDGVLDAFVVGGQTDYPDFQTNYGRGYAVSLGIGTGPNWTMFQGNIHRTGSMCEAESQHIEEEVVSYRSLNLEPNPSSTHFSISLPDAWINQSARLEIISLQGSVLHSEVLDSFQKPINIEHLPNGIYIVRLYSEGIYYREKLIKLL
jgi:outer membrane protein assembly factor BamB